MLRLLVHVEGQTEESFVNEILCVHLMQTGYSSVSPRIIGNPRRQRGGIRPWSAVRSDILRHLKEDRSAIATMMVDYYGMPNNWPGRLDAPSRMTTSEKAVCIESALLADIAGELGTRFDSKRFVPLVMMHEFEAMLFSDPDRFANAIYRSELAEKFRAIRQIFATPEEINDSVETAPSKRIVSLYRGYQKPLDGINAVKEIGLTTIRKECSHFDDWMLRLEALPAAFSKVP